MRSTGNRLGSRSLRVTIGILGVGLAALAAPVAAADPAAPVIPVESAVAAPVAPVPTGPAPGPAAAAPVIAAAASIAPPDGVSHLPSPQSLPPGTTDEAPAPVDHPTLGYLKDVWNAVRGKQVSPQDALLLIAQRPVNDTKLAGSVPSGQGPSAPAASPAADSGDAASLAARPIPPVPAAEAATPAG